MNANLLNNISGVQLAKRKTDKTWILAHDAAIDIRPVVFQFAVENGLQVLGMQKSERGLEEVFKELTKR